MNSHLNILLSSDENYVQHLGATIYSVLTTNQDFERITFYIIDNDITEKSKDRINSTVSKFSNADIKYIKFDRWKSKLNLDMSWNISISAYARLFVSEMLPEDLERVLYMDCDMIVCKSLKDLWKIKLDNYVIGAVQDAVPDGTKIAIGLQPKDLYFNSGMLLINLNAWREQECSKQCVNYIISKNGNVTHHDQGVLNHVFKNAWVKVPLEYDIMTIHYFFNFKQIQKYFQDHAVFYSIEEIEYAKKNPIIIHYTPSFTTRPWVKSCKHPLKYKYWDALAQTPWKNAKPTSDNTKWYLKLINFRYRCLPY